VAGPFHYPLGFHAPGASGSMLPKGGVGVGGRSQATFLTLQTRSQVSDFESKEARSQTFFCLPLLLLKPEEWPISASTEQRVLACFDPQWPGLILAVA